MLLFGFLFHHRIFCSSPPFYKRLLLYIHTPSISNSAPIHNKRHILINTVQLPIFLSFVCIKYQFPKYWKICRDIHNLSWLNGVNDTSNKCVTVTICELVTKYTSCITNISYEKNTAETYTVDSRNYGFWLFRRIPASSLPTTVYSKKLDSSLRKDLHRQDEKLRFDLSSQEQNVEHCRII